MMLRNHSRVNHLKKLFIPLLSLGLTCFHFSCLTNSELIEQGLASRQQHQVDWKVLSKSGPVTELSFVKEDELSELLAILYAKLKVAQIQHRIYLNSLNSSQERSSLKEVEMKINSDEESIKSWLLESKKDFASLKDVKLELLSEVPNRTINVCQDSPKILIFPNVSKILYCYNHEQWIEKLWWDLRASIYNYYPIIILNILIFLIGTTGNVFVCLSVYRNHQLRNVTNYFIVNLAFADLLVIIICLPATQIWDLSLTWFFGTISCKLVMFLQDVSISVSVLTLTAISLDRYYAICHPLKFKSSLNQAKRIIALIWLISLAIMSPDLIYLSAHSSAELQGAGIDSILYSDCDYDWTERASKSFQFVKTILLYLLPFILMLWAHYTIMQTLHLASTEATISSATSNCPLTAQELELTLIKSSPPIVVVGGGSDGGGVQISLQEKERQIKFRQLTKQVARQHDNEVAAQDLTRIEEGETSLNKVNNLITSGINQDAAGRKVMTAVTSGRSNQLKVTMHNKSKLESRKKAAKMLTAIVIIFGICYLPVHLINFFRQFIGDIPQTEIISSLSMLAHCICYLNSAINPIIYNHMNSVFRAEFKKFLLPCRSLFWRHCECLGTKNEAVQTSKSSLNRNSSIQQTGNKMIGKLSEVSGDTIRQTTILEFENL